jgi:4-amino-4-deoxy-L-arabinose transferase-like glycosyltransferase
MNKIGAALFVAIGVGLLVWVSDMPGEQLLMSLLAGLLTGIGISGAWVW